MNGLYISVLEDILHVIFAALVTRHIMLAPESLAAIKDIEALIPALGNVSIIAYNVFRRYAAYRDARAPAAVGLNPKMPIAGGMILLALMFGAGDARAQGTCDPATIFKSLKPTNFFSALKACSVIDVAAVVKEAQSETPQDLQTLACFIPLQGMMTAQQTGGVFMALQMYRAAKRQSILTACTAWINSTLAP